MEIVGGVLRDPVDVLIKLVAKILVWCHVDFLVEILGDERVGIG
jgi:hypothetical protein